jgi:hypothetical protein
MKETTIRKGILMVVASVMFLAVSAVKSRSEQCEFMKASMVPCMKTTANDQTPCDSRGKGSECAVYYVVYDVPTDCQTWHDDATDPVNCVFADDKAEFLCYTATNCEYSFKARKCITSPNTTEDKKHDLVYRVTKQCP